MNREYMPIFILVFGLTVSGARTEEPNFEAEEKQAAQEEEKANADRKKGIKSKVKFVGRYISLPETTKDLSPSVVGKFVTIIEGKPSLTYHVKVEGQDKDILKALKLSEGKNVQLGGKLRNLDEHGVAKYFIVSMVTELVPTPRAVERNKPGGI